MRILGAIDVDVQCPRVPKLILYTAHFENK